MWGPCAHFFSLVRPLVEPTIFAMCQSLSKCEALHESLRISFSRSAAYRAHHMLADQLVSSSSPAILGIPSEVLVGDFKFQENASLHVHAGERMAQAALQIELLVCADLKLPYKWYIERSQYQRFDKISSVPARIADNKPTAPAANFCGCLSQVVKAYIQVLTNDFHHHKLVKINLSKLFILGNSCSKVHVRLNTNVSSCNSGEVYTKSWKGDLPNLLVCARAVPVSVRGVLAEPDSFSDLVLVVLCELADGYKTKAIRSRCAQSANDWRTLCIDQRAKGAGYLHLFVTGLMTFRQRFYFSVGLIPRFP